MKTENALDVVVAHNVTIPDMSREQIELVKRTVAKGTTDDELQLFLYTAKKVGLDPLVKQIHAIKRWSAKDNKEIMSIQTGIDGYRLIADRTGKYAGNDDYEFDDSENQPKWAKARVWKIVGGLRCQFEATARWSQYYPGDKQGFMWKKMPHVMLGKCAEGLALRKAFPAELSGVYTFDEMAQAPNDLPAEETAQTSNATNPAPKPTTANPPSSKSLPEGVREIWPTGVEEKKNGKPDKHGVLGSNYKIMDNMGATYRTFSASVARAAMEASNKESIFGFVESHPKFGDSIKQLWIEAEDIDQTPFSPDFNDDEVPF